jgi:hypothetical protein
MTRRISLGFVVMAAASCAPHVEDMHPTISQIGIGRILTVDKIVGDTGESTANRYIVGWASGGGPVGAIIAGNAQKDLSRSELFNYGLRLTDGTTPTLRSFSVAAANDCVKITRIGAKTEVVFEQVDHGLCDVNDTK